MSRKRKWGSDLSSGAIKTTCGILVKKQKTKQTNKQTKPKNKKQKTNKQKLDPVSSGWPFCLKAIDALALFLKDADELILGQ